MATERKFTRSRLDAMAIRLTQINAEIADMRADLEGEGQDWAITHRMIEASNVLIDVLRESRHAANILAGIGAL
jgi:hypothetical protein